MPCSAVCPYSPNVAALNALHLAPPIEVNASVSALATMGATVASALGSSILMYMEPPDEQSMAGSRRLSVSFGVLAFLHGMARGGPIRARRA